MEEGDDEERSEPGERKVEVWTLKLGKKKRKKREGTMTYKTTIAIGLVERAHHQRRVP